MNNLTTRKIVLGMLMTLVLAFSVQGTADAQTYTEKSGDHQFASPGNNLRSPLVFTVAGIEKDESDEDTFTAPSVRVFTITAATGVTITSIKVGSKANHTGANGAAIGPTVDLLLPADYTYDPGDPPDEETADEKKDRLAAEKAAKKVQDEAEKDHNDAKNTLKAGSNTINVYCRVSSGSTGVFQVTASILSFTVYGANNDVAGVEFDPVSPGTDRELYNVNRYSAEGDISVSSSDFKAGNLIDFTVISGSGRLYFDNDDRSSAKTKQTVGVNSSESASIRFSPPSSGVTIVEAWIRGTNQRRRWTFFSQSPTLHKVDEPSAARRTGVINTRLLDPLTVEVRDGSRSGGIPNQKVKFTLTDSTDATLVDASDANNTGTGSITLRSGDRGRASVYLTLGATKGTYDLDVDLTDDADTPWHKERFIVKVVDEIADAIIEKVSGDKERVDPESGAHPSQLVVRVLNRNRQIVEGSAVTFRATVGTVSGDSDARPLDDSGDPIGASEGQFVTQTTDENGEAAVTFVIGDTSGDASVRAVIDPATQHEQAVTFTIYGRGGAPTPDPTPEPAPTPDPVTIIREVSPPEPRLIIEPSTLTGGPGSTYKLTIRAVDASGTAVSVPRVAVSNLAFIQAGGQVSPVTITAPITANVTLPSTPGQYKLSAAATGYQDATVDITVAAGTLSVLIDPVGGAPGTRSTVTVTATNAGGRTRNVSVTLGITTGGGTLSPSLVTTNTSGTAISILTRGRALGDNYFVTATADGYTQRSVLAAGERVVISETQISATGSTPPAQPGASGVAADLDAYDGNQQVGSLNSRLAEPFIVEVVDANDNPVEDARVRFRTTIGSGRFSPRTPRTDEDGFAETTFTPTSAGRIRVVATVAGADSTAAFIVQGGEPADALEKVSGDNQSGTPGNALASPFVVEVQDEDGEPLSGHSVTFSVTAGGGSLSETSATTNANGRAQTTLTLGSALGVNSVQASVSGVDSVTFSTSIDAKILVTAANRPMMYWIAGGGLYSLSGAKEAKIAESANGVAVGGGKIYWTSQVNASSGAINSANLDGTGATTLTTILAVPMGIAVDTAGSKLYWTNSRGRIQSANLNGSSIKNVMQNLTDPTDIVVSNGFIYWTEGGNSVRRVNMSGQVKIAIDVAVNLNTVGGLAVGGGKVYWTEMTSASAGTVNGADLNGTNFAALATLLSAPMGISVDTAGSKLYWTNARGRVQSANLDGSGIKNVVEGLISPSKLAIGGANTETTTTAKKATTPAKKDNAKYDVNGDGTVDNTDASLVSAGFDTGNAKYDVNGDGKVSFLDLLLVFDNRDDDAAAAPAIVGMKLNAVQIDRIEEQIDLLIATNDRSPAAMRTLVYMQQLLATARPEKTQLFANYPNPFNPETWLPYELATDTHVKITIYNTQGVVIRTLQFGHQSAGYYTERDRAAYWDGRNALGEQVASGLYFYQLETDEMSSMRKMVILK